MVQKCLEARPEYRRSIPFTLLILWLQICVKALCSLSFTSFFTFKHPYTRTQEPLTPALLIVSSSYWQ